MGKTKHGQIHNNYFQRIFTDKEILKEFVIDTLGEDITESLKMEKIFIYVDTVVNDKLEQSRTDVRMIIPLKNGKGFICIIIEAKSTYSRDIARNGIDQVERYTHDTWDIDKKENKKYRTPVVAIILYNGEIEWDLGENVNDAYVGIENTKLMELFMSHKIKIVDLRKMKDEEIRGSINLTTPLFIMKYIREDITLISEKLEKLWKRYTQEEFNSLRFKLEHAEYIIKAKKDVSPEEVIKILKGKRVKEVFMTAVEKWEEKVEEKGRQDGILIGEKRGRQDGILLGLEKKAVEIARKMKIKGRDVSEIMEFTGLTQDEVEAI